MRLLQYFTLVDDFNLMQSNT